MTTWTALAISAVKDPSGLNSNIIVTATFTSVSGEVQTRTTFGSNLTVASLQSWAAAIIATLVARDTALAAAQAALANGPVTLATG